MDRRVPSQDDTVEVLRKLEQLSRELERLTARLADMVQQESTPHLRQKRPRGHASDSARER